MHRLTALVIDLIAWAAGSLAIMLAVGAAASFVCEQNAPAPVRDSGLAVAADGRLLIWERTTQQGRTSIQYTSPDRQPVSDLTPAAYGLQLAGPGRPELARGRTEVLALSYAPSRIGERWFAVAPVGEPDGKYLVGFDGRSGQCVGYLGADGCQRDVPPAASRFAVTVQGRWHWLRVRCPSGQPGSLPLGGQAHLLLAGDRLWLVTPALRELQPVADVAGLVSATDHLAVYWPKLRREPCQSRALADRLPGCEFALRGADRIVLVDSQGQLRVTIPLAPNLRNDEVTLFLGADSRYYAVCPAGSWRSRAYELLPDQQAALLADVELPHRPGDPDAAPKVILTAIGAVLPAVVLAVTEARTHERAWPPDQGALARELHMLRWPLRLTLALGLAAALLTWRHQRRHRAPFTWLRVPLAVLAGVPGWLAYRYLRRWPAIERCAQCSRPTPTDRATCVTCGQALTPQAPSPQALPALREP